MNSKFEHLIITRFNYDEKYPFLNNRLNLFKKYTLPSFLKQTNRNFKWIIISNNPEVNEICNQYPFIQIMKYNGPLFIDNTISLQNNKDKILSLDESPFFTSNIEWRITTRIDNDDMILPDFVKKIQLKFDSRNKAIDCQGYRLNHLTNQQINFDFYSQNRTSPFVSVIQNKNNYKPIYLIKHSDWCKYYPVEIIKERLWIQIIHENNKLMRWEK